MNNPSWSFRVTVYYRSKPDNEISFIVAGLTYEQAEARVDTEIASRLPVRGVRGVKVQAAARHEGMNMQLVKEQWK